MNFYVQPSDVLAVATSNPAYAAFATRIGRCGTPYTFVAQTTYATFKTAFDALSADARLVIMNGVEFPWLAINSSRTDASVDSSWTDGTYAGVQTEFTRQGLGTVTVGTTLAQLQQCGRQLWIDCATYAKANGCRHIINFSSFGVSFNNTTGGIPRAGMRSSATNIGYWLATGGEPTFASVIDTASNSTGSFKPSMSSHHDSVDADGCSNYNFVPHGADWSVALPKWTSGGIVRKNSAGATQSPDFEATTLREARKRTVATWCYEYRRGRNTVAAADTTYTQHAKRPVANICTFSPATPDLALASYIRRNHWCGLFASDPTTVADDVIGSLFFTPDTDTPNVVPPDEVWLWDSSLYYWVTFPTNSRALTGDASVQKQIDAVRVAMEKLFFGRPQWQSGDPTGDEPAGGTDWSAHDTYNQTNNLGDALWYRGNSTAVWRNSSGTLHATIVSQGLTINFAAGGATAKLAPYFTAAQVAGTANITQADVESAIALYISEWMTQAIERAAAIIQANALAVRKGPSDNTQKRFSRRVMVDTANWIPERRPRR